MGYYAVDYPEYAIVKCPKCGMLSISRCFVKSHSCPKCGTHFLLRPKKERSRILAHATTLDEARGLLYAMMQPKPDIYRP